MNRVSAVITTHKRPPEIVERALKSVIAQTYPIFEIVVVDDSPSDYAMRDAVAEMVNKYSDRNVKYIQHEKCMGACAARNTGAANTNCDFIAFLDDDDEWESIKIEKQIEAFGEDEALVYCNRTFINETTGEQRVPALELYRGHIYQHLILNNFIGSTSFPLIRKEAFDKVGGFDVLMRSAQDYDLWLRIAEEFSIGYVDLPLVRYYCHGGEQITKNNQSRIDGLERLCEKNKEYLSKNRYANWIRRIKIAPFYYRDGQKSHALLLWLKCALSCPFNVRGNLRYLYVMIRGL